MPVYTSCKRSLIKKIPCHEQGIFLIRCLEVGPDVVADAGTENTAAAQHNSSNNTNDDVAVIGRRGGFRRGDGHFFRHEFSP